MLTIQNPKTFDWANMSLSDCCEGNAMDSYFTLKLFDLICDKLDPNTFSLVEKVLAEANPIFADIEYQGMPVDSVALKSVGKQLRDKNTDNLYAYKQVLKTDNISSTKDLIEILYTREGGFELYPPDKTNKGKPSVSAPTLKLLLEFVNEELAKK